MMPRKNPLHLCAFLILFSAHEGRSQPDQTANSGSTTQPQLDAVKCDSYPADREEWCPTIAPYACGDAGEVGRSVRSVCPTSCKICLVGGSAQDAELAEGGVVEFRTGRIAQSGPGSTTTTSILDGWQLWLEQSGALEEGFPVGKGRVKVKHTDIFVSPEAPCEDHLQAAKTLVENHRVQAVTLRRFGPSACSTNVSMALHESGVIHLIPTGQGLKTIDGQPYINKHLWDPSYDITQYPVNFLTKMRFFGHTKFAVVYNEGHDALRSMAHHLINDTIPGMADSELVYTFGWPKEKGGNALSKDTDSYVEAHDTDLWDQMLSEVREAGADVILIYGQGEAGSIVKRMKAMELSFSGVFGMGGASPLWAKLMGSDGDFVVTPGQWHPALRSTCEAFGSAANFSTQFAARFGRAPNYHAAMEANTGLILQYAMQGYNSVATNMILAGLQTINKDTFYGRNKFSYRQNNIGQSPVSSQLRDAQLRLVLPEELAATEMLPFMDWRCRPLHERGPAQQPCSDSDFAVHEFCKGMYPVIDVSTCEARALEEEQAAARRRMLAVVVPCVIAGIFLVALLLVWLHGQHRRYLQEQAIQINFSELRMIPLDEPKSASGRFNALGVTQTSERTLKYADLRGTKVVLRDRSRMGLEPREPELPRHAAIEVETAHGDDGMGPSVEASGGSFPQPAQSRKWVGPDALKKSNSERRRMSISRPITFLGQSPKGDHQMNVSIMVPVERTSSRGYRSPGDKAGTSSDCFGLSIGIRQRAKKFIWLPGNVLAAANLRHRNLVPMHGITTDRKTGTEFIVMESMALGSVRELVEHDQIGIRDICNLLAIIRDIISGLRYLHEATHPFLHGDLRAKNVLLDGKLTAKVRTDVRPISLSSLKEAALELKPHSSTRSVRTAKSAFSSISRKSGNVAPSKLHTAWTAPELLATGQPSTKTDIYALGITIWELFAKSSPYEEYGCTDPMDLSSSLVQDVLYSGLRPRMPCTMPGMIKEAVVDCLRNDPSARPCLEELDAIVASVQVECQAKEKAKRKNSEQLLHQMLPPHVAEALRNGRKVEPQLFEPVTIFFSDIVGYTDMSATMEAEKVMDLLDRLYHQFDKLSSKYGLFKVETIGDAYMCVGGIPAKQNDHTARVAQFALEAVAAANNILVDLDDESRGYVNIRAGFHSGSVIASVVGELNPRYCLFGDTVNTASRMESNSEKNRINMSPIAHHRLQTQGPPGRFQTESRGQLDIKGKGTLECFFLNGFRER